MTEQHETTPEAPAQEAPIFSAEWFDAQIADQQEQINLAQSEVQRLETMLAANRELLARQNGALQVLLAQRQLLEPKE